MKISTVLSIIGVAAMFVCAWRTGGDPPPQWNPPPTKHNVVTTWCTPVAVPLYDNGTDCR